jgi:hypothetical protein
MIRVLTAALALALVSSTVFAQSPWCDRQLASPRVTWQETEFCRVIGAVQREMLHEIPQPAREAAPKQQVAKIQPIRPEVASPADPAVDSKCRGMNACLKIYPGREGDHGTVSFRSITR